jgi:hypothetical protein
MLIIVTILQGNGFLMENSESAGLNLPGFEVLHDHFKFLKIPRRWRASIFFSKFHVLSKLTIFGS